MLRAFEKIADRHRDRIFTFACYHLGNRDDAEDVTQEVLVRLWKNLDSLEDARIMPWLIHVTRNACIDSLRRRRTYPGVLPLVHLDHIYHAGPVEVRRVELVRTRRSLIASDHLPLVAELAIGH